MVESLNKVTKWEGSHAMQWAPLAGKNAEEEDRAVIGVVDGEALEAGARMFARRAISSCRWAIRGSWRSAGRGQGC